MALARSTCSRIMRAVLMTSRSFPFSKGRSWARPEIMLKGLMISHKDLVRKIERLGQKFKEHDKRFILVFEAIKQLLEPTEQPRKIRIRFHP